MNTPALKIWPRKKRLSIIEKSDTRSTLRCMKLIEFHSILIATPEKTVCDKLYFSDKLLDPAHMKAFVFDSLRLDPTILRR